MRHVLLLSFAALALAACGGAGEPDPEEAPVNTPSPADVDGREVVSGEEAAHAGEAAAEEAETDLPSALASLPAPYSEADLANGRRQFRRCSSCHTIQEGGPHRVGPNLYRLFSRHAGTAEGFNYSRALVAADFDWSPDHLDAWLADPRGYIEGNRMSFVGLRDENDRRDVIAYLMIETAAE